MRVDDVARIELGSFVRPPEETGTDRHRVETVLGYVEKDNPKAKTTDPKSLVDDSLLKEIEASGFVKTLYAK